MKKTMNLHRILIYIYVNQFHYKYIEHVHCTLCTSLPFFILFPFINTSISCLDLCVLSFVHSSNSEIISITHHSRDLRSLSLSFFFPLFVQSFNIIEDFYVRLHYRLASLILYFEKKRSSHKPNIPNSWNDCCLLTTRFNCYCFFCCWLLLFFSVLRVHFLST